MTSNSDPLLQTKGYATDLETLENVKLSLGLTNERIEYIASCLSSVYIKKDLSKNALTMMQGAIFAISSKDLGNPEWREHCSGSLRGLVEGFEQEGNMASAFCNTFKDKNPNFPSLTSHPVEYKKICNCYSYFSEIHHHNANKILLKLQALRGKQMKTGSDTNELFLEIAKEYLDGLYFIFQFVSPTSSEPD